MNLFLLLADPPDRSCNRSCCKVSSNTWHRLFAPLIPVAIVLPRHRGHWFRLLV